MSLADITREAVLEAIAEYDTLGQSSLHAKYGIEPDPGYVLIHANHRYEAKTIAAVAHQHALNAPLPADQFDTDPILPVTRLRELYFPVLREKTADSIKTPHYGEPIDIAEGTRFAKQIDVYRAGVHRANQRGIVGNPVDGAESIIVSGGYEDDLDYGSEIIYTGEGGRGDNKVQVADQSFTSRHNAALVTSKLTGRPVRVTRGAESKSKYAPAQGYRYDGLFRVEESWSDRGRSGYLICRYRLVKIAEPEPAQTVPAILPTGNTNPARREIRVQRIVRSTKVAEEVKRLHDHTCQACNTRLAIGDRGTSEGAHIRGLGQPHVGPDVPGNVLCLCPNCHTLFDNGALIVSEDLTILVNGVPSGTLRTHPEHVIASEHLAYHRKIHSS